MFLPTAVFLTCLFSSAFSQGFTRGLFQLFKFSNIQLLMTMILSYLLFLASCFLGPDPGPCSNLVARYYYSADQGSCQPFIYGGCQGNANRFDTKAACQTACGDQAASGSSTANNGNNVATISTNSPPVTGSPTTFWSCTTPHDHQEPPSQFWMRSSFFQLFRHLKVVCNGAAFKWQVISRVNLLDGLYLSVWRPTQAAHRYKLVGMTKVSQMVVTPNQWIDIPVKEKFSVAQGDILGLFYDSHRFTDATSSIPLMPGSNKLDKASQLLSDETYVSQLQASDIFNLTSVTVDLSGSAVDSRRPALALIVDPTGSVRNPDYTVDNRGQQTPTTTTIRNNRAPSPNPAQVTGRAAGMNY